MNFKPQIFLLEPDNLTENIWGGSWLFKWKGLDGFQGKLMGESWELSTHKDRPSQVKIMSHFVSLRELVQKYPREIIGKEILERTGSELPLLLKFIDACDDLSVQVHPPDAYAREKEKERGKAESWVILKEGEKDGEGFIYVGFNKKKREEYSSQNEFKKAFIQAFQKANQMGPSLDSLHRKEAQRLILPYLNKILVKNGQTFHLKAGTIHAIGKGVRLIEIQQSSGVTYRVWDWNRPCPEKRKNGILEFRELHTEKALDVIDFTARETSDYMPSPKPVIHRNSKGVKETTLIEDKEGLFALGELSCSRSETEMILETHDQFFALTVYAGKILVFSLEEPSKSPIELKEGRTVLIPACLGACKITFLTPFSRVFKSYVPL